MNTDPTVSKNLTWKDVEKDPNARKILDHGFIVLKDWMGTDATVAESARVSYGEGTKSISSDKNLIRYLVRNHHTTPLQQNTTRWLCKLPIFVMRQLVRHRTISLNEVSARYSILPNEFYLPEKFSAQATNNKQGRDDSIELDDQFIKKEYSLGYEHTREVYERAIASGVARELARINLPVSVYTMCYFQCDLHNLMNFLRLRMDSHAQYEIRVYANAMHEILKEKFPICMEAFDDYILNAKTFSASEMALMKSVIGFHNLDTVKPEDFKMTTREFTEFKAKMGL